MSDIEGTSLTLSASTTDVGNSTTTNSPPPPATTTTTTNITTISSFAPTTTGLFGQHPSWQQSMIRIRDPKPSLYFYCTILQMTHLDTFHFPQYQFSLYFIATLPPSSSSSSSSSYTLTPGTKEAHDFLWNYRGTTLELTHNHGTELSTSTKTNNEFQGYHPGNQDSRDGFGHFAIMVNDVYETCQILETMHGCTFPKKPNEGRMKGLAFVHDPDKYWIEIIARGKQLQQQLASLPTTATTAAAAASARSTSSDSNTITTDNNNNNNNNTAMTNKSTTVPTTPTAATIDCNLSQTMLRIKNPTKSIPFYLSLGMKLLQIKHFDTFSLYFLGGDSGMIHDHHHDNNATSRMIGTQEGTKEEEEENPLPVDTTTRTSTSTTDISNRFHPVLELTHNHGTEAADVPPYYNGNEPDRLGFGHMGFLVDNVYATCDILRTMGYGFRKEADEGTMKGLAFCYDPDGYSIEIIKRGGLDFGDMM